MGVGSTLGIQGPQPQRDEAEGIRVVRSKSQWCTALPQSQEVGLAKRGEVSVLPLGKGPRGACASGSGPVHLAAWSPQVHIHSFIHIHCMYQPPLPPSDLTIRGSRP